MTYITRPDWLRVLPTPGSPRWHAWRKSGLRVEEWLEQNPAPRDVPGELAAPAAQQTIAPRIGPVDLPPIRTQPEPTSAVTAPSGIRTDEPPEDPWAGIGPLYGEAPSPEFGLREPPERDGDAWAEGRE